MTQLPEFSRIDLDWLPTFYITSVRECFFRHNRLHRHLLAVGMENYQIVPGFNGWQDTPIHSPLPTNPGSYGCALSKMEILEKYGSDNIVFLGEDDARFAPDWRERLLAALQHIPDDWEVLQLGAVFEPAYWQMSGKRTHIGGELYTYSLCHNMSAMLLRGSRVQKLFIDFTRGDWKLDNGAEIWFCDRYFPLLCLKHGVPIYCIEPRIVKQAEGYSFIDLKWRTEAA